MKLQLQLYIHLFLSSATASTSRCSIIRLRASMVGMGHSPGAASAAGVTELAQGQEFETIAGFILALLVRVPRTGEQIEWQDTRSRSSMWMASGSTKSYRVRLTGRAPEQGEHALASGALLSSPFKRSKRKRMPGAI
jgi:hypothetical protein